jgi:two-component system nitrate/nitrite response regulator NarL
MSTLVAVLSRRPLYRAGLVSLLNEMGFDRVAEGADINDLKRGRNGNAAPEILLINPTPGTDDVASSMEDVGSCCPQAKVVFLAADVDLELLSRCYAAGASGFLLESISREALQESLKLVCAGEKVFPSNLAGLLPGLTSGLSGPINRGEIWSSRFSEREIDVLRCLSNGQSNKVIAHGLRIAESTVKVHVKRILQKTQAQNRTQAALWGAARGVTIERPSNSSLSKK